MAIQPRKGRKPSTRKISIKEMSLAVSGPEQPYPTYQFSNRAFFERPNHNPFKNIPPSS